MRAAPASGIGAVLTARQSTLLTAGDTPLDAFLGGYRAGLLLAAGLVALGGVAAYVGLRRRTARDEAALVAGAQRLSAARADAATAAIQSA